MSGASQSASGSKARSKGSKSPASESAGGKSTELKSPGLKSMTGYAQAQVVENGVSVRVTVRSVNHRFLDLHLRMPDGFEPVEPANRSRPDSSWASRCHCPLRACASDGRGSESRNRRGVCRSREIAWLAI